MVHIYLHTHLSDLLLSYICASGCVCVCLIYSWLDAWPGLLLTFVQPKWRNGSALRALPISKHIFFHGTVAALCMLLLGLGCSRHCFWYSPGPRQSLSLSLKARSCQPGWALCHISSVQLKSSKWKCASGVCAYFVNCIVAWPSFASAPATWRRLPGLHSGSTCGSTCRHEHSHSHSHRSCPCMCPTMLPYCTLTSP